MLNAITKDTLNVSIHNIKFYQNKLGGNLTPQELVNTKEQLDSEVDDFERKILQVKCRNTCPNVHRSLDYYRRKARLPPR